MTRTNNSQSPFQYWNTFDVKPQVHFHPIQVFLRLVKWILLFSLVIIFFWGLGTLFFNKWVNSGQVEAYQDGQVVKTYTSGVFFELVPGYENSLKFKRHIFHVDNGTLYEYDYYAVNNITDVWYYSKSAFYALFVFPTSWILTQITKILKWNKDQLGSNYNLLIMIVAIFLTTFILRLISGVGSWKQQQNQLKMKMVQSKVTAIKTKYKDATSLEEKQKMQWEIMNLYRQEKINPLSASLEGFAFAPVLFAMFIVVRSSRVLKDSGTSEFSFTTTLWDQIQTGDAVYFIPAAVYLFLFAIDSLILPRLLVTKNFDASTVLENKKSNRGAIFKWVFKIIFIIFFFIVPVGTSVYWIFSLFFEGWQKIIVFFVQKFNRKRKIAKKQGKEFSLWRNKSFDAKSLY